jgi:fatty acyl-CoA reductase
MSGVFRNALLDIDVNVRMVPVDYAVNSIIAVAWKRSLNLHSECTFYNSTDSPTNQITWRGLNTHLHKIYDRFVPYEAMLYYPRLFITGNFYVYTMAFFLTQFVPGVLFDLYLLLAGHKTL